MRSLLWIILALVAAAAAGMACCAAAGWAVHPREMSVALGVIVIASAAGVLPVIFNREAPAETVARIALVGSGLHLMLGLALAVGLWLAGAARAAEPFAMWLIVFYWVSLVMVATTLVRCMKRAAAAPSGGRQAKI